MNAQHLTSKQILEMINSGSVSPEQGYQLYKKSKQKTTSAPASATHYFTPAWEQSDIEPAGDIAGPIMIFALDNQFQNQFKQQLKKTGYNNQTVISVKPGTRFRTLSNHEYEVNPKNSDDYSELLATLKKNDCLPLTILHLWSFAEVTLKTSAERDLLCDWDKKLNISVNSIFYLF